MKQPAPSRRVLPAFLAACAGVLAAGMTVVWAAGCFEPDGRVDSHSALPVQDVLMAENADLLFWPEALWNEGAFSAAIEPPAPDLAAPWTQVLVGGLGTGRQGGRPGGQPFLPRPGTGRRVLSQGHPLRRKTGAGVRHAHR